MKAGVAGRWGRICTVAAASVTLNFGVLLVVAVSARGASSDQSVAYQLDAAHDGYQTGDPITTPLSQAWSVDLGGAISYPLVVNGVVYVTVASSGSGTTLYALEQATGSTLWSHSLGGTYPWSGLAYDAGQVFTVNSSGLLTAFDASSGVIGWSVDLPGQTSFDSPPTAINGYVYTGGAGSGGTVYAVSEASGQVVWTQAVENGDISSPAVDAHGVYVTYACDQDYDLDPLTGALIWHHSTGCEGGGGKDPVLANGDVFSRDPVGGNVVLSASTGSTVGAFNSTPAPAVGGGSGYTVGGGALTAVGGSGLGTDQWTFTGDGSLDTAPLVVGNLVFEGSSSRHLYAIDASTGSSAWSTSLASAVPAPDEQNVSQPLTGLGAGEGTLIVPTGSTLTAFTGANVGTGTPTNTSAPTVAGSPVVGQAVAADVGTWTGLPTSYGYQWEDCDSGGTCSDIVGATGQSYTPTSNQIGTTLKVSVSATNTSGTASAVTSPASATVKSRPVNTGVPQITGTASYGHVLTASTGSWTQNPTSYTYEWLRCRSGTCSPETGVTTSSYTVASGDIGSQIEVQVTAVNSAGATSATSQPTATVPTGATTLSLTPSANPATLGSTLTITATVSPRVDGGTVSFGENGQPVSWCQAMPVNTSSSSVSCTGQVVGTGQDVISATYSGDANFNSSSASLTEQLVSASAPTPSPTVPPTVALTGTPPVDSSSPTLHYQESGNVSSTLCTLDGAHVACDSTHAVLSHLSVGKHTFMVQVFGAGGSAHASVTWSAVAPPAKLAAPRGFRARRTRHGVSLSWVRVDGARAYSLTVSVGRHTRTYKLSGSARSFRLKLRRRQHARVSLRATGGGGQAGAIAVLSVT
jgi:outer membrane protein assembly factor BamB